MSPLETVLFLELLGVGLFAFGLTLQMILRTFRESRPSDDSEDRVI